MLADIAAAQQAPPELPQQVKAKPAPRRRVSDSAEGGNEIRFGAISRARVADEPPVRTADASTASDKSSQKVVQAIAKEESERGNIRRVSGADGEVAPAQWTASRPRSVLVNGPRDHHVDPSPAPAPSAPTARRVEPVMQPTTGRRLPMNCGKELEDECEEARKRLKYDTIDRIQLDLAPLRFSDEKFDSLDAMIAASEELTRSGLAQSEFRQWVDRTGHVIVAHARLLRVRSNSIVVIDEAGVEHSIPFSRLSEGELCFVADEWGMPANCELPFEHYAGRHFTASTFTWTASALCHKPLYFEQIELERYGHTPGPILEAPMAGAKFAADIATLPYKMGINPPNECRYALGYYRPGDCAPWIIPPVPLSLRGAIFQATAVTGISWIIP